MDDTSLSLIDKARANSGDRAWERFVDIYSPLLHNWLSRLDIQAGDADDLVQEVMIVISRELPGFEHNGRTGAFRKWIRTILVNRVRNHWRVRDYEPAPSGGSSWTARIEQLADDRSDASREWDLEHDRHVMARLLAHVRTQFETQTWEAFHRQVVEGIRADVVAAELGVSLNSIYVARSRVLSALRREAQGLIDV
jgi:RNA polymerase sigma factor (sigma-70 family)